MFFVVASRLFVVSTELTAELGDMPTLLRRELARGHSSSVH